MLMLISGSPRSWAAAGRWNGKRIAAAAAAIIFFNPFRLCAYIIKVKQEFEFFGSHSTGSMRYGIAAAKGRFPGGGKAG
jgi:hypothetical protein